MNARQWAVAAVLAVCLGAPVTELFDRWDQPTEPGGDTELSAVVAALCVGTALSAAGAFLVRVGAVSATRGLRRATCNASRVVRLVTASPVPHLPPLTRLRV